MADTKVTEPTTEPAAPAAAPATETPAEAPKTEEAEAPKAEEVEPVKAEETKPAETAEAPKAEEPKVEETKPAETTEAPKTEEAAPAVAAAEAPKETEKAEEPAPVKPASPFDQLAAKLPDLLKEVDYDEVWGVKLDTTAPIGSHVPTQIILQKYLNANDNDLTKAIDQLKATLKFRKEKKPLELMEKSFSSAKFGDLGLVTWYEVKDSPLPEVFTWNLYGNVKDRMDDVFVPLDDFMEYRIALQELGVKYLNIAGATEPITETKDPYKMIQVHDYKGVSFLRQNPNVRAASTEVIKQFALVYPELLKEKFFVNVPAIMGWVYGIMKLFVAEKTRKKFHPMANGANLAAEFTSASYVKALPKEYGGEAGSGDGTLKGLSGNVQGLKLE